MVGRRDLCVPFSASLLQHGKLIELDPDAAITGLLVVALLRSHRLPSLAGRSARSIRCTFGILLRMVFSRATTPSHSSSALLAGLRMDEEIDRLNRLNKTRLFTAVHARRTDGIAEPVLLYSILGKGGL